jgi:hypothetical protein
LQVGRVDDEKLVLTGADMSGSGRSLANRINRDAASEWDGYSLGKANDIEVTSINRWFRALLGREHPAITDRAPDLNKNHY